MKRLLECCLMLVALLCSSAYAADYFWIVNKWKPEQRIHIEHGRLEAGTIQDGAWSAQWTLQDAGGGFYRIVNKWKPEQRIHIERGVLESSPIQDGAWSAQWAMQDAGGGFYRLVNKWKPEQRIHIERGVLESGPIHDGAWSAQWKLVPVPGNAAQVAAPAPAVALPGKPMTNAFTVGKCLQTVGEYDVRLLACNNTAAQRWLQVVTENPGSYRIKNVGSGKCLYVVRDNSIQTSDCDEGGAVFNVTGKAGWKRLQHDGAQDGCLDVVNDATKDKVQLATCGNYSGQAWK